MNILIILEILVACAIIWLGALMGSYIIMYKQRKISGDKRYNNFFKRFKDQSYCANCNTKLKFNDTWPILSYFIYKGKCRYCGQIIPKEIIVYEIFGSLFGLICAITIITIMNNLYNSFTA
jgi:prepilin signal peptidase PulO-like enzyme (type II secretory pathway)